MNPMQKVSKARESADMTDLLSVYRNIKALYPTRSTLEALYLNSPPVEVPEELFSPRASRRSTTGLDQ